MQPGETFQSTGSPELTPFPATGDGPEISWTASEYIAHQKSSSWYVAVGFGSAVLALLIYLLTRDAVSAVVIVLVGIIFGVAAARQPRTLTYNLSHAGLKIGEKFYPYTEFKSFSVLDEEAMYSILLLPMRRFMPGVSIYYPPDQEDDIMAVLSSYLPHEMQQVDMVDRLARKLRF